MAQYSNEIKHAVYVRIIKGQSIKKISKDMKINPRTLGRWKNDLINQYTDKDSNNDYNNFSLKSELTLLNIKLYS